MSHERGRPRWPVRPLAAALSALALGSVLAIVGLARRASSPPSRCGGGFVELGPRCCAPGQRLGPGQRCEGRPSSCGPQHRATERGCVPVRSAALVARCTVQIGPSDWEAQGVVSPRQITAGPLYLDRFEATVGDYLRCQAEGHCPMEALDPDDPGRALLVSLDHATALCRSLGGRLPSDDEWTVAAMGQAARRYPWGDTGAVCARAAFGLVRGPCAEGAEGPDTAGAHPLGRSPEGLFDLAGNAPEWTLGPGGAPRLRGGSYASELATELRGWRAQLPPAASARAGARCAYDEPPETAPPRP